MMDQRIPKKAVWEAMLYAAAPYAGDKELEEYYAADPTVLMPEKARKKMFARIHREQKYREAHESYRPVRILIQRILLAVITGLAVMMVVFLPSEKVREAMWETVVEWGEESILVSFTGTDMTDVPTEILEYREPRGIGEEFERTVVSKNEYKYFIQFIMEDKIILYEQKLFSEAGVYLSNEETNSTIISIGKYKGILTEYVLNGTNYLNIAWTDGEYKYLLTSNLSMDYIIDFAENIQ